MKRKELEEIIKSAFIAEMGSDAQYAAEKDYSFVAEIEVEEDLDEMLARLSEKEESLDDILAGLMGESISEENIDSETKKILNPLEDLRALAEKGDDEKFKSLINYGITLVNKYMIAKIKDGKTLNLDALKAATMELLPKAKAKGGYLDDGDLNAFMKFSRNPYLGTDPYLAEDLYEAEEEEEEQTDVTIDAKEKTTDGGEEKTNDSIALNFFTPTPKKQYKSVTFKGPAQINIIGNQSLTDSEISINGITIPPSQRYFFRNDSLQIISSSILSDTSIVIIKNNKYADTIILKTKLKERIKAPSLSYLPYVTGNPLELFFSDSVLSIKLDSIIVLIDSIPIEYKMLKKETNRLTLSFIPKKDLKKITLKINPNGILFSNFKGDYSSITKINFPDKNDLGSIKLKLDSIKTGTILQLLKNNQEIAKTIKKSNEWLINDLVKGEYNLRLIMDENNNGIWDTGSISELRQPEEVRYLNKPLLARANWEIEVTLSPTHFNFK